MMGPRRQFLLSAALVLGLLLPVGQARAQQPGFDCSRATRPDETAICSDERLAELDRLTSQAFSEARAALGVEKAREIGRALLKERAGCGPDRVCIFDAQVKAMVAYDHAGVSVASPANIGNYRKLIAEAASGAGPAAPAAAASLETEATRNMFPYLTPAQRAFIFDPKWFAGAPDKSFTATFNCTNCGSASPSVLDKYVLVSPSVHRQLQTIIKIDEPKGYTVLHGLFTLQKQGNPIAEISLRSDLLPVGRSNQFGLRLVTTGADGVSRTIITVCSGGRDVVAASVALYANGSARVYACTESRQTGSGEIVNRQLTYTYFADYGAFYVTYWNEPRTGAEMKIYTFN